jgi:alkaline phosphatase D
VVAAPLDPQETTGAVRADLSESNDGAFPQSVASGGPTPSGAIVWTRVDPQRAAASDGPLRLQVVEAPDRKTANDAAEFDAATTYDLETGALAAARDHTVSVDLDGELDADRFYFYRFVLDGTASPVGRLRTLPAADASPERLRLAVTSCNNYLDGYYGAFAHVAEEAVDYHVSLGDFIYEYGGAGQQVGRDIVLPSEAGRDSGKAHTLADFRHLHRTYRSDDHLRAAMERHTLVHTWDDHEVVNNRWWNDEQDAPGTASHPYGGDPERMRELYAAGITAMAEYLPLRVEFTPPEEAPEDATAQDYFRLYRSFRFGDLAELFMTDERLYRDPPPEDALGQRDVALPPSPAADDLDRSMLGLDQLEWFLSGGDNPGGLAPTDGLLGTDAHWKLWGNEILTSPLQAVKARQLTFELNYDAWDGYQAERRFIMGRVARRDLDNFVTLTGDMHSYVAAYMKEEYDDAERVEQLPGVPDDRVGVEFMTPGVTSDNLAASAKLPGTRSEDAIDRIVRSMNPHMEWFNSSRYGYTVLEFTRGGCTYTAYGVDRAEDSADAARTLLRTYRVPSGRYELQEFATAPRDKRVGSLVADSTTQDPDEVEMIGASGASDGGPAPGTPTDGGDGSDEEGASAAGTPTPEDETDDGLFGDDEDEDDGLFGDDDGGLFGSLRGPGGDGR